MILAEVTDFELWQRAVRQQFQGGESLSTIFLGVGVLVGVVVLVIVLGRLQSGWRGPNQPKEEPHPHRLYTHLLCSLGFTSTQRRVLESLGKACGLEHPTALLISDVLFDRGVASWERAAPTNVADAHRLEERRLISAARARLFPQGHGIVQSPAVRSN